MMVMVDGEGGNGMFYCWLVGLLAVGCELWTRILKSCECEETFPSFFAMSSNTPPVSVCPPGPRPQ